MVINIEYISKKMAEVKQMLHAQTDFESHVISLINMLIFVLLLFTFFQLASTVLIGPWPS
jgi:hypothetical protein